MLIKCNVHLVRIAWKVYVVLVLKARTVPLPGSVPRDVPDRAMLVTTAHKVAHHQYHVYLVLGKS